MGAQDWSINADVASYMGPMTLMWLLTLWIQCWWHGCSRVGPYGSDVAYYQVGQPVLTSGIRWLWKVGPESYDKLDQTVMRNGTTSLLTSGAHTLMPCWSIWFSRFHFSIISRWQKKLQMSRKFGNKIQFEILYYIQSHTNYCLNIPKFW
jgi:hypothetical protein